MPLLSGRTANALFPATGFAKIKRNTIRRDRQVQNQAVSKKAPHSRRANLEVCGALKVRRSDLEMQRNAEIEFFAEPSEMGHTIPDHTNFPHDVLAFKVSSERQGNRFAFLTRRQT
jgi:hypothetical protein